MTLDTRLYVLDQVDHLDLFRFCRELLGATSQHTWYDEQDSWPKDNAHNPWTIGNHLGQGLPALLDISYRPGAPLRTPEQAAEHDLDICNVPESKFYNANSELCDGSHSWWPACWCRVSFDTGYAYSDDRGYGCGDLHAEYVSRLGQWLDAKGVGWKWENEFTGEVHTGYEQLVELGRGGFKASEWFRTTVVPAIAAAQQSNV